MSTHTDPPAKPGTRVLHLPSSVGGNAWSLAQGERALGWHSTVLTKDDNQLGYQADLRIELPPGTSLPMRFYRLGRAFLEIRSQYDVFHFNYGSSLLHAPGRGLHQLELPYYPHDAVRVVTYNGCDARQKYPTMQRTALAACHEAQCYGGACNSGALDEQRRQGIARMAAHVDHIWALNPDLLYFLPAGQSSFLPYAVGLDEVDHCPPQAGPVVHVAHAPTNREVKGSAYVLAALERLDARYPGRLAVDLIEGLPHLQAMQRYRQADLVVDQILVGWYGRFAVEMMLMGKPVIARIAEEDLHFLPPEMAREVRSAVISATPDTIEAVLAEWISDPQRLVEQGERGRAYAQRWHAATAVAAMTTARYQRCREARGLAG